MWIFLSLFVALSTSVSTPIVKKLTNKFSPIALLLISNLFVLPIMFGIVLFLGGFPRLSNNFYFFIVISSILDTIAFIFSIWAIKISPISLIAPIASFNPVFTTIIAGLTIHEIPDKTKFFGILLIVVGAYLINIKDVKHGLFYPVKKLFLNRGVQLFFLANFLWSITPIFQKKAIYETSPVMPFFPSFFSLTLVTLIIAPFAAFSQFAAYTAYSQANVGYVTAIFRLSILFTIFWGALFFKEKNIKEKFIGATIMILGTILIVL